MKKVINCVIQRFREMMFENQSKQALKLIWTDFSKKCELKKLTPEQITQIQDYWEPLVGKKVSTKWHQLIFSITGVFNPKYEPFEVCMKVQNTLSPIRSQWHFDDKGLYRQLLTGFNIPIRVAECVNGVYLIPTKNQSEVNFETFVKSLENINDCIIKPSRETDGGNGVMAFDVENGIVSSTGEPVKKYILDYQSKYGKNYVIEKKLRECENLQCLNPTSVNSLRVHTYRDRSKHEIVFLSSYLRIGKLGKVVDNAHSGGFCARINSEGYLDRIVRVYPYLQGTTTESGVDVRNYKIENYEKLIETVKQAHSALPMFDLIGWDVIVDSSDEVVIIEFNPNPDVRIEQCVFDNTCLGEFQEEIVRRVYNR